MLLGERYGDKSSFRSCYDIKSFIFFRCLSSVGFTLDYSDVTLFQQTMKLATKTTKQDLKV